MTNVIYRVTYADGSMCHTAHKPLAVVWAKRKGSKLDAISLTVPPELRSVQASRDEPIRAEYERGFNGVNRTSATWAAFRAGWNAAKPDDQSILDSISARYFRDTTGEPVANPMANQGESSSSPVCPLCNAKLGQEHAPACPRHPSDPMAVRRAEELATDGRAASATPPESAMGKDAQQ